MEKLVKIAKIRKFPMLRKDIDQVLGIIKNNAHRVFDEEFKQVAIGLFPMTSMINHSCVPNSIHYFEFFHKQRPKLIIRAVKDIAEGQEVAYSYVPLYQSTATRQRLLRNSYGFTCTCARCTANANGEDAYLDADCAGLQPLSDHLQSSSGGDPQVWLQELTDRLHAALNDFSGVDLRHRTLLQCYTAVCRVVHDDEAPSWQRVKLAVFCGALALGCIRDCIDIVDVEAVRIEMHVAALLQRLGKVDGCWHEQAAGWGSVVEMLVSFGSSIAPESRAGSVTHLLSIFEKALNRDNNSASPLETWCTLPARAQVDLLAAVTGQRAAANRDICRGKQ